MGTVWAQLTQFDTKRHPKGLCVSVVRLHHNLQNYLHLSGVSNPGGFGSDGWNRTTDLGAMKTMKQLPRSDFSQKIPETF